LLRVLDRVASRRFDLMVILPSESKAVELGRQAAG